VELQLFPVAGRAVTVHAAIDDGLMTVFFLVVGLEIKRELVSGELRTLGRAVLPALAALGGMLAPAAVFLAVAHGGPAARGWAIPMATDIAFAIGVLALLGDRVPASLRVFITALAIFDDVGGILVIAIFYGHGVHPSWLLGASALLVALALLARAGLRAPAAFLAGVPVLWLLMEEGGIHPTLAGVLLAMTVPADERGGRASPLEALEHALHPFATYAVMPAFALVNSGVTLGGGGAGRLLGVVFAASALGLFLGKQLGIFGFTWAAVKLGISPAPEGARPAQLYGVAVLGGIGFTVALFIANLAFAADANLLDQARLGILVGSLVSGLAGMAVLRAVSR
jgi:NhaA family Na+:H+ antiporter